jgi:hypothetical protein
MKIVVRENENGGDFILPLPFYSVIKWDLC